MIAKKFRNKTKNLFLQITKPLAILPITPNQFTFLSIPLAIVAAFFIINRQFWLALLFMILSVSVDLLDGSFAENKKMRTPFGNYFDSIAEKTVESIFYIGFAFVIPLPALLAYIGSMLESLAKPRAAMVIITEEHDWPNIGERGDRLLLLIFGVLASAIFPSFQMVILTPVFFVIFVFTMIGFVQRIFYARRLILKAEKNGTLLPYLKRRKKKFSSF